MLYLQSCISPCSMTGNCSIRGVQPYGGVAVTESGMPVKDLEKKIETFRHPEREGRTLPCRQHRGQGL